MTNITDVSDHNFDVEVLKSDLPVLTYFWSTWCASCRIITPHVESIADEYKDRIKIAKLNLDDSPMTSSNYSVLHIPTLILFKFGQPVEYMPGTLSKADILKKTTPYLDG